MAQTTARLANLISGTPAMHSLYLNDIWRLARQKWEMAGRPSGDSSPFWLAAEEELLKIDDAQLTRVLAVSRIPSSPQ
jgi:hypothetical protein